MDEPGGSALHQAGILRAKNRRFASVAPTDAPKRELLARGGHLDLRAQAEVRSVRRADTPTLLRELVSAFALATIRLTNRTGQTLLRAVYCRQLSRSNRMDEG